MTENSGKPIEVNIKRISLDNETEQRKARFIINDKYMISVELGDKPQNDNWLFSNIITGKKYSCNGNIMNKALVRDNFAKDVAAMGIIDKKSCKIAIMQAIIEIKKINMPEPEVEEKKEKRNEVPIYETEEELGEIIFKGLTTSFAIYNKEDGSIKYNETIENSSPVVPVMDDGVILGAVLLPTKAQKYESEPKLLEDIIQHIHTYLDIPPEFERMAAYYIFLSWIADKINTIPYLRVLGDTGVGKSRFLDVVGRLCYRACIVSGAVTPAPIYRMIKKWQGSIIIDEADFAKSDTKNEVIKILNCGFEKMRPIMRCVKDDPDNLQFLPSYGPKVLATRYVFYDKALESRCITYTMEETERNDIPPVLPRKFFENEREIRNKLLMFRFKNRDRVNIEIIEGFDISGISPRLKQAASAFAVFMDIPGLAEQVKSFFTEYNQRMIEERAETVEGEIVAILIDYWEGKLDISAQDIANELNKIRTEKRKTNARGVGRYLKSLKLERKNKKLDDDSVRKCIVWNTKTMKKLARRYVPGYKDSSVGSNSSEYNLESAIERHNKKLRSELNINNKKVVGIGVHATNATSATISLKILEILGNSTYPYSYIINEVKKVAFGSVSKVEEILEKMKEEGRIFEPTPGVYKKV